MKLLFFRREKKIPEPECDPAETPQIQKLSSLLFKEAAPQERRIEGLPPGASWLQRRILAPLDQAFVRVYGARFNPLYRSGTLAVALLALALISGVYLLLFYRVGAPFESMQRINAQAWGGRWIRALHRYVSDAAFVATLLHFFRMFAEGKSWGPRALAWISGLVLAAMLLAIAWSGYVLVWDQQALELARVGGRMLDLLPIFPESISRAFGGAAPPPSAFFFMNLFLHLATPLGIVIGLWLHTSRLARSSWLPQRKEWLWAVLGFAILSVLLAAPLGSKADPLALGGSYPIDLFFTFWLPWASHAGPGTLVLSGLALSVAAVSAPWWWKPGKAKQRQPSSNDESRCAGCVQCVLDCPFEAVNMVPRAEGSAPGLSSLVARVDAERCVSCGLCSASCEKLSIGPPDLVGTLQIARVHKLCQAHGPESIALLYCGSENLGENLLSELRLQGYKIAPWSLDCMGTLHPYALHALLGHFRGVFLLGCPPQACRTREGYGLLEQRLQGREPSNHVQLDTTRTALQSGTRADLQEIQASFEDFAFRLGVLADKAVLRRRRSLRRLGATAASAVLLAGLAFLSRLEFGAPVSSAALRLSWRLPGQALRICRDLTAEELKSRPAHMRRKQECTTLRLSYHFKLDVDGKAAQDFLVQPQGLHHDSPLNVDLQLPLAPGLHEISASFEPSQDDQGQALHMKYRGKHEVLPGRALLLTLDKAGKALELIDSAR